MDLSRVIIVSDRHLFDCEAAPEAAFLSYLERVSAMRPHALLLREKDMREADYLALARRVRARIPSVPLILHSFPRAAKELPCDRLHLPLALLQQIKEEQPSLLEGCSSLGASVHAVDEAVRAVSLGASYLIAGNIYETGCKPGLAARGLPFLTEVCKAVPVPVYAIGGITPERLPEVLAAGAAGACMRSALTQPSRLL